jgi:hypothetical protein
LVDIQSSERDGGARPWRLSETLLLAAVPAFAYALTFVYEAGYLGAFGLPAWLIEIEISRVFVSLGGLLVLVYLAWTFVFWVPTALGAVLVPALVGLWLALPTIPMLFFLWILVPRATAWYHWILVIVTAAFLVLYTYLVIVHPLLTHRDEPKPLKRIYREALKTAREQPDVVFDSLLRRAQATGASPQAVLWAVLVPSILLFTAYFLGERDARRTRIFLVSGGDTVFVALRSYHDHIIAGVLDSQRATVGPQFVVVPVSDAGQRVWTLARVGPLRRGRVEQLPVRLAPMRAIREQAERRVRPDSAEGSQGAAPP